MEDEMSTKTEDGKLVFDADEQKEVDRIIGERLARAKNDKPADYDDLKGLSEALEDFEAYAGLSAAEKKALLKQVADDAKRQRQSYGDDGKGKPSKKAIEELAEELGMSPEDVKKAIAKSKKDDEADRLKAQAEKAWNDNLKDFKEKHPDVDIEKLDKDPKFLKFTKGKGGMLSDIYDDFLEFIGDAQKDFAEKVKLNSDRSTSSGRDKGSADGGTYGLSDDEKSLVDDYNRRYPKAKMTYKEFSERKRR
jgi:hypothetical protein